MINAKAVAVVSEPAVLMRYIIQTAVRMNFLDRKMAEYAQAVCHGSSAFPYCTGPGYQSKL